MKKPPAPTPAATAEAPPALSRRGFLGTVLAAGAATAAIGTTAEVAGEPAPPRPRGTRWIGHF